MCTSKGRHLERRIKIVVLLKRVSDWSTYSKHPWLFQCMKLTPLKRCSYLWTFPWISLSLIYFNKRAAWTVSNRLTGSNRQLHPTHNSPKFSFFSADHEREGGMDQFNTQIVVDSSGTNKWLAPVILYSSCKMDVKYFPFDTQVGISLYGLFNNN